MPHTITDLERFEDIQREALIVFNRSDLVKDMERVMGLIDYFFISIRENMIIQTGNVSIMVDQCRHEITCLASYALAGVTVIDNKQSAEGFIEICHEARDLFISKNRDYGDSYKNFGSVGVIIRLTDKILRLQNITAEQHEAGVPAEFPRDTLLDLANYAVMAALLIDQGK